MIDVRITSTRSVIMRDEKLSLQIISDGQVMATVPLDRMAYNALIQQTTHAPEPVEGARPDLIPEAERVHRSPAALFAADVGVRSALRPRTLGETIGIPVEEGDESVEEATTPFEPQEA